MEIILVQSEHVAHVQVIRSNRPDILVKNVTDFQSVQ